VAAVVACRVVRNTASVQLGARSTNGTSSAVVITDVGMPMIVA
jgi:hypothetical protein